MRVFRFMSKKEFDLYNKGIALRNMTFHGDGNRSSSIGFCFLDCNDFEPEEAIHFLSGLVSTDVCAIFDVDKDKLRVAKAQYADNRTKNAPLSVLIEQIRTNSIPSMEITEYCTTHYSAEDFKLVKYITDIPMFTKAYFNRERWKWNGDYKQERTQRYDKRRTNTRA